MAGTVEEKASSRVECGGEKIEKWKRENRKEKKMRKRDAKRGEGEVNEKGWK